MSDWFTVERLDGDTYAISEYRHWEHTHCYLLLGRDRALVIDTGLGVAPLAPVVGALTALPVAAALTHAHWDHIGGLGGFGEKLVHGLEAEWLSGSFPLPLFVVECNLTKPCPAFRGKGSPGAGPFCPCKKGPKVKGWRLWGRVPKTISFVCAKRNGF